MEIAKSSRHSKITGGFGEAMVTYLLSKHGFECARIDHTGIDIIARHPTRKKLLGIAVQSRSRSAGKEDTSLLITAERIAGAETASQTFLSAPYAALVFDRATRMHIYLISVADLRARLGTQKTVNWSMTEKAIAEYKGNARIGCFEFDGTIHSWGNLAD